MERIREGGKTAAELLQQLKASSTRQIVVDQGAVDRAVVTLEKYLESIKGTAMEDRIRGLVVSLWEQWHEASPEELKSLEAEVVSALTIVLRANLGGVFAEAQLRRFRREVRAGVR